MRVKATATAIAALLAGPATAWAADGESIVYANNYSAMLERHLFTWHIWTTGVSRLDDGALFGFASMILVLAFAASGIGIILFRNNGLGFRGGWVVALATILGALVVYCVYRPYPTMVDLPSMLLFAMVSSIAALFLMRLAKGAWSPEPPPVKRKAGPPKAVDDSRIKMAIRSAQPSSRRNF